MIWWGVKIGCDGMRQDVVNVVGGVPVFTIPRADVPAGTDRGFDSVLVSWGAAMDWQLQEQVKYVLDLSFGGSQMAVLMNQKSFDSLSAQDQQILMEVAAEAEKVNREEVYRTIPAAKEIWTKAGVTIYKPTAADQKLWFDKYAVIWQQYIDKNLANGTSEVTDVFDFWKAAVDKAHGS
jgi:TRAP-type C4-dicarboxylate transport system substrate-binding protein